MYGNRIETEQREMTRQMHARNQWNAAEKVITELCEMTVICRVTLSGHFFDVLRI